AQSCAGIDRKWQSLSWNLCGHAVAVRWKHRIAGYTRGGIVFRPMRPLPGFGKVAACWLESDRPARQLAPAAGSAGFSIRILHTLISRSRGSADRGSHGIRRVILRSRGARQHLRRAVSSGEIGPRRLKDSGDLLCPLIKSLGSPSGSSPVWTLTRDEW